MFGGKYSVFIFCIFLVIETRARAPSCTFDRNGDRNCDGLLRWEEDRRRTTTTRAPRFYSAEEFGASAEGTISCRTVQDCPALSEEQILTKLQLDGIGITEGEGCEGTCGLQGCSAWCPGMAKGSGGVTLRFGTALTGVSTLSCGKSCRHGCPPALPCRWKKNLCRKPYWSNGKLYC
eukprot:GFUD01006437.1.p1 GENE.GFUD01006437.1~~GFUD01006437.1.p1  ORF type:complete len:190 (+),score=17.69 GFUD01006437.1:40-570(+)